jgi:N-acetylglucosaminyldiphosphoundecaprenol N-acetyl-beta-D-mannosaminyltransferase
MFEARATVLGCELDRFNMNEAVDRCRELIESRRGGHHVSVNAAKLIALRSDPRLRAIVQAAEVVTADGTAVVWASRLLGDPLPTRVAGIDLLARLLEMSAERSYRVYLLGARREVLERAVANIRARHPQIVIAGYRNGYFSDEENDDVCAEVRAARPDILVVGMSSPRKEYWLADHGRRLGVPLMLGVGGSLDVWAGIVARAPRWMQRAGLEWLFRLVQEPRRLWRRYLVTNALFVGLVGSEVARRRIFGSG